MTLTDEGFMTMASFYESELSKSLLVLAMAGTLAACGGSDNNSDSDTDDHSDEEHHDEEHAHTGGRLIYSVSDDSGLNMYDQTVDEADAFSTDVVTTSATGATLVLAKNGLTAAMLDNGAVSIVDAGLEHLAEEDGHTHDVSATATNLTSGITMVVATHEYFSAFDGTASTVIDAEDGTAVTAPSSDAYPTLALTGGHFLTFMDGIDGSITIEVKEANGESLAAPVSATCNGDITATAQTEHLTQILCSNDSLLSVIAAEGETDTSFTITTDTSTTVADLTNLTATFSTYDVIAGWSTEANKLVLSKAHSDHVDTADISSELVADGIITVAAPSSNESEALGVLGTSGRFLALFYHAEGEELTIEGSSKFDLDTSISWSASDLLLADSEAFIAVNLASNTLFFIDGHDGESYHLHSRAEGSSDLSTLASAVLAHAQDDHDHDEEDGESDHDH
jgi:hypothetical protein